MLNKILSDRYYGFPNQYYYNYVEGSFYNAFEYILVNLIDLGILKIRNLEHLAFYGIPNYGFRILNRMEYKAGDFELLVIFSLLKQLLGSLALVEYNLKLVAEKHEVNKAMPFYERGGDTRKLEELLVNYSIPLLIDDNILIGRNGDLTKQLQFPFTDITGRKLDIRYSLSKPAMSSDLTKAAFFNAIDLDSGLGLEVQVNGFDLMYKAFLNCLSKNRLKENVEPYPKSNLVTN